MGPNPDPTPQTAWLAMKAEARRRRYVPDPESGIQIQIGMATCGIAAGALETQAAFEQGLAENGIPARVHTVGCNGHCYAEPMVIIDHPASGLPPLLYHQVTPGIANLLVRRFLKENDPCLEYALGATVGNDLVPCLTDYARFNLENRVVMDKCGRVNPADIYDYIDLGGYGALAKTLTQSPAAVIETIKTSGLRGRGGAGFPTGHKWELAARAQGPDKHVICNADEGDPGAYMDRTLLESNPHQVLEGMLICAYAAGAGQALIYIRAEYPLAVRTFQRAIDQAYGLRLLGPSVLGTSFGLEMRVFQGSGAFVCGEETALIRSVEGFRGMPRQRPPYPVHQGLEDQPTIVNNVRTLASVPPILEKGASWYRQIGTPSSPGTAIFSVVGDVNHPGLVEVPMGMSLRHLIFDVCGGIAGKKQFKAVQIGGPSGGCLSEAFLETPIDFEALVEVGAMMGSGGMVVLAEDKCMVDLARYFVEFTQQESCGKCTFCRIGTQHLRTILERLTTGQGRPGDLMLLERIGSEMQAGSLCALGSTAPNPVLTSLIYFGDEYRAHLEHKKCPGLTCRSLTAFYIDLDKCARGCDACVGSCPVDAVFTTSTRKKGIDLSLCVKCGECMAACPPNYDAVRKVSPPHLAPQVEKPAKAPEES